MNEYKQVLTESELSVTEAARNKIAGLINDTNGEASAVRIFVSGGGCSGMNYGMTFAENDAHGKDQSRDSSMNGENGFKLVVDPIALSFLNGAEIDYADDGVNATFVFNNVFQAVGGSGSCGGCGGA